MIVILTLAALALIGFGTKFLLDKGIFPALEKGTSLIAKRLKWKYWVVFLEILFTITTICSLTLFFMIKEFVDYIAIIYFILILSISVLIYQLREQEPEYTSLFSKIKDNFNTENYFFSRIDLFFKYCLDLSLIVMLVLTYTFIIELEWPTYVYFIGFLVLPIYSNIWIYFTVRGKLRDNDVISIRRGFAYFLLSLYAVYQAYILFLNVFFQKSIELTNENNLILYIAAFVFIAIEQVLKAFTDDYIQYKNDKQSNKNI
jgi:hypothetical protein